MRTLTHAYAQILSLTHICTHMHAHSHTYTHVYTHAQMPLEKPSEHRFPWVCSLITTYKSHIGLWGETAHRTVLWALGLPTDLPTLDLHTAPTTSCLGPRVPRYGTDLYVPYRTTDINVNQKHGQS